MEPSPESRKSIWKKPWKRSSFFLLILAVSTFAVVFIIGIMSGIGVGDSKFLVAAAVITVVFVVFIGLIISSVHWLCRPRNLRVALFGLVCFATLIALFYLEEDARGKWAWSRFKREWEAKGEKFDFNSFVPPAVPDDQNFAMTLIMVSTYGSMIDKTGHEILPRNTNIINRLTLAFYRENDWNKIPTNGNWAKATLTDLRPWQAYYRTPPTNHGTAAVTNEFPAALQPQSPAEDVLLALSKCDSPLEELRQASRLPDSRFPLEYDKADPAAILLPHLARFKQSAQFLQLRALAELQAGQIEKAAADVKLMLYLTDAPRSEPFLISHLVRIGVLNIALQPVYEGLAEHKWTDGQLAVLDSELAKFDFLADYTLTTRGQVAFTAKMVDYLRQTRKITPYLDLANQGGLRGNPAWDYLCYLSPSGWFHQNQISFSEFYLQKYLLAADAKNREFSPKASAAAEADLDESLAHPRPHNLMKNIFLFQLRHWFSEKFVPAMKFAYAQQSVDMARVAIALERYRLAHNEYPDSLDVLAPNFIGKLPHDLIGGQPLKYRKTAADFVLYSVGWNEKDDGGIPAMKNDPADPENKKDQPDPENGDWVWTYPAK